MRRRIFIAALSVSFGVLIVHSLLMLAVYYFAASSSADGIWAALGEQASLIVWIFVLDAALLLSGLGLAVYYIFRPLGDISRRAAMGAKAETNYADLAPIVELLNQRNEEVDKQFEELEEDKEFMARAARSKDEFVANITHEMNTPLTGIRGYAELLATGKLDENRSAAALDTILKQSERLAKMISCVISYNEIDNDSLPPYEVDVSETINGIINVVLPEIEKRGIAFTADIEPGLTIISRTERVRQVASNLISNAVKYNKESGGTLAVTAAREGGIIRVTVADGGVGIPKKELGKIFERFYTIDKSHNGEGGGFGLGLATVKKICKNSGWIINVASKQGEGTTFVVELR